MGHATISTERANDLLITVHAPFLAMEPNQNATLVCPLYNRSTMLGRLLQIVWVCFFGEEKKTKYCWAIRNKCLRQWSVWNFWRAIEARCVTRVGRVFFGKTPWRTFP